MKTVLPQGTGDVAWGGVPLALLLAIGLVILFSFAIVGWDCWRSLNRRPAKSEPCDEDKALDRLASEVDRHLDEREKRRGKESAGNANLGTTAPSTMRRA